MKRLCLCKLSIILYQCLCTLFSVCVRVYRELQRLLQRSIACGEGNSLLLIGPKGSGKTWVSGCMKLPVQYNISCCMHVLIGSGTSSASC